MKKTFIFLLIMLIFLSNSAYASEHKVNILNHFPIRETFESIGYEVTWDDLSNTATVNYNSEINFILSPDFELNHQNQFEMLILNGKGYASIDVLQKLNIRFEVRDDDSILLKDVLKIYDKAPSIDTLKLSEEKKTLLFFWATWCPYCDKYIDNLNNLLTDNKLKDDTNIIAINIDPAENLNKVNEYIKENLSDYKTIIDSERTLYDLYTPRVIPTTFFIDKNGIVYDIIEGYSKDILENLDR